MTPAAGTPVSPNDAVEPCLLGDLMHVSLGWQARSDVDELAHS